MIYETIMADHVKEYADSALLHPALEQVAALERAAQAARDLKPVKMVEALHESYVMDGLIRRLQSGWSSLQFHDAQDIIAESVNVLYRKVAGGTPVHGIVGFLMKVAHLKAYDMHGARQKLVLLESGQLEREADKCDLASYTALLTVAHPTNSKSEGDRHDLCPPSPNKDLAETSAKGTSNELDWEDRMKLGLAVARRLLPRLGQDSVRNVMAYIFDGLETGRQDITAEEIANALGITKDTARQARHRGFTRLERLAKEENLLDGGFDFKSIRSDDGSTGD
jgi:DNA-directed RNA polymerase specialized sigma24 family protein